MSNTNVSSKSVSRRSSHDSLGHVADARVLLAVFASLIVLTAITVAVSYFNFGLFNLLVAMSIATVKAVLVALWFMHLRYENKYYTFLFLVALVFLGLFLMIIMLDSVEYFPQVEQWQQQNIR